jgi:glucosamine--fructose-6-phosphate aminotransferase (isomerizing)
VGLIDEIREQPAVLDRVIAGNVDPAEEVARLATGCTHAVVAARGTSDNAARYAQYVWGTRNQLSVGLTTPSLFSVYDQPPLLTDALVVGISQSGESPDIVAVLEEGRRQGRPTVAISNEPDSPLARSADVVVDLMAGEERAVAATKTYTAQLAVIALISDAIAGRSESLGAISQAVTAVLEDEGGAETTATSLADIEHCAVLGRGYNHATAFEWALKLQELTYVVAQPFSTADFLHGPIAVVEPGYPVLAVSVLGPTHDDLVAVLDRALSLGARVLAISDDLGLGADMISTIPAGLEEWLTPIPAIVAAQVFSYRLTLARGLDPDRPRGLSKVTRTN